MIGRIHADEPSDQDRLGRRALANAFAELAQTCQTPFVVGIFGTWGSGKTTFLRLMDEGLDSESTHVVWFNAWEHDQDDAPAISLLHATVESLGLGKEFRHSLTQVALAFGSVLMKKTTSLSIDNLEQVQNLLDRESFRVREARAKLKQHFQVVLNKVSGDDDHRVIFLIDDLDRCSPEGVMRVLSAIKLYFTVPGCVFFLAIDRETIEDAIGKSSGVVSASGEARYLDKMIQLPFLLPPIAQDTFEEFVAQLLPADLRDCIPVLSAGLERNPRTLKRFVNNLLLRHSLAGQLKIPNYDPRLLALLLLIEQGQSALFRELAQNPERLRQLHNDQELASEAIFSPYLRDALKLSYVPRFAPIVTYFSLTNLDVAYTPEPSANFDWQAALSAHRSWLRSFRQEGARARLKGANLNGVDLSGALLREASLSTALMNEVNLNHADLRRAEVAGTTLRHANMQRTILRFTDLRESDLQGADLRYADLRDADLTRANLRNADLRHSLGLTSAQLRESLMDEHTKLPLQLMRPFASGL